MRFTFRTRVWGHEEALSDYALLFSILERKLFARVAAGSSPASLKREYVREHRIPARVFNSVRVSLEGRMASGRESQRLHRSILGDRISRARKRLADVERRGDRFQAHQKRRRLANLESRLAGVETDLAAGRVRLCFGSKRLWRKQHRLAENGYGSHQEWLADWQEARRGEFFLLGSRDETGGCQLCVASIAGDGSLTLRLRMPDRLAERWGKYLVIEGVRFAYGHDQVLAALGSNGEYAAYRREHGEKAARATGLGQAVSYRFKRDRKGWQVFVTVDVAPAPLVTDRRRGVVGVDLNADHLPVCLTDGSGNDINAFGVPLVTYGKSICQGEALIGDAVAWVVGYAKELGKPIVIERLDFQQKKAALEGESQKYSRMLSSFSYGRVKACFLSRGFREEVEVHQVNPAYSSVIGRVKFMERYGLSVHQAAALVLARRLLGCSERIPRRRVYPIGNGVHVAFSVPVRKRVKHVWTYWGAVLGQLRPALAAQHRLGSRRRGPNPVRTVPSGDGPGRDPFGVPG